MRPAESDLPISLFADESGDLSGGPESEPAGPREPTPDSVGPAAEPPAAPGSDTPGTDAPFLPDPLDSGASDEVAGQDAPAHELVVPQMPQAPPIATAGLRFPSPYDRVPAESSAEADPEYGAADLSAPAPGDPPALGSMPSAEEGSVALDAGGPDDVAGTPDVQGDWMDIICPYLLSEDGTWRSTQPDANHRCTAQDPPGTLPLAFQERFCLTDRHDRCEMYKYAQTARSAALEEGGIAAGQVEGARFKPSVRSVPLALGPSGQAVGGSGPGIMDTHRHWVVMAAIGGVVILVVLLVLILGGGGSGGGVAVSPGASPGTAGDPTAQPTAAPTPAPTTAPGATAANATAAPAVTASEVRYEVQENEALAKIAAAFGTTRKAILRANEGMSDKTPFVVPGDIIVVPISRNLSADDISAVPGFIDFVDGS